MFKANSPAPAPEKPVRGKAAPPSHSHYLQSKVVRARERIEAEHGTANPPAGEAPTATPPPPEAPGAAPKS